MVCFAVATTTMGWRQVRVVSEHVEVFELVLDATFGGSPQQVRFNAIAGTAKRPGPLETNSLAPAPHALARATEATYFGFLRLLIAGNPPGARLT